MFEVHYLFKDSTNFEVLIIPIVWSAKEELGLGEIKQLAQAHIAGWSCVNLNASLFNFRGGGGLVLGHTLPLTIPLAH